ncbi:MAG TPA: MFS transporter, partial [Balneolaceae bacterium]|nr:MFS transporter [Balneolaceae bacterium]
QRATVFSIYSAGIFLGIGFAFLIGGNIAEAYNWRISLKAVGLPGIILAFVAWFIIKEVPRGAPDEGRYQTNQSMGEVLSYILAKKTMLWHFAGFSFLAFSGYTILAFIGVILKSTFHSAGLIPSFGWFMFGTGASVIAAGKMADWLAARWGDSKRFVMGIVAGIGCLPFYYFGLFADSEITALVFVGIAVIISSSYNGVAPALVQYLVKPNMRALAGGVYLFIISVIGFGIGPPLTGWLIDHVFTGAYGPSKALMLVFTVCGILGSICFLFAMKTYNEDAEKE